MQLEVQSLEADLAEKKRQLEEITPVYKDLELYFGQRCDEYSCMKKAVVGEFGQFFIVFFKFLSRLFHMILFNLFTAAALFII